MQLPHLIAFAVDLRVDWIELARQSERGDTIMNMRGDRRPSLATTIDRWPSIAKPFLHSRLFRETLERDIGFIRIQLIIFIDSLSPYDINIALIGVFEISY